ncbi:MAG: dienelactone hydrolase [Alphaproteobacteria bacterium]|nr:dienelactone hydrolase [Alphaproteobacteria bacterium]MBV8409128.1 dienelactone hydrolase [Alphaproteobacteria bacterium]
MRVLAAALVFLLATSGYARADGPPFHVGVTRVTVQDAAPFEALIAYPTGASEVPTPAGPFTIAATRDAPIATGARFPIVLFSHGGNGKSEAGPLVHQALITSLTRRGFIVIAPFHPATSRPLEDRPRQNHEALELVLNDPRFAAHADQARLGMIGFSYGGALTLIAAGGIPSLAHLAAYCTDRTDDPRGCGGAPKNGARVPVYGKSADVLPLKAIVLLEPFGALFDREGLQSVKLPVLLYRAEQSDLGAEGNIFALAAALPRPPQMKATPGGHFVFVDPCPSVVEEEAPVVCKDAAGVDRATFHKRLEADVATFLERTL